MDSRRSRTLTAVLAVGIIAVLGSMSLLIGGVPQTITVDGSNDFLPANLVDIDGGDTEFTQIDIDTVYVTNDAIKLYIGFYYDKDGWSGNQLGIMISVSDATGGTTDAWGHAIAWNTSAHKPDFQAWCNMDNSWQELREWNSGGGTWDVIYSGTGGLGWVNNTGFEELALNLSDLGVTAGDTVYIEWISTQSGSTKGPLDAVANDDDQLSTPGGTTWDVAEPVECDSLVEYIIQASGDADPPFVEYVASGNEIPDECEIYFCYAILACKYNEPVDLITAENAGNYSLTGTTALIDSVRRDPSFPDKVWIYLDSPICPQNDFYKVEVTNVEDLNSNVIVDNDTTNVGCFFLKAVLVKGFMGLHLRQHSYPVDTFTVEGSLAPLTWGGCDNAFMTHMGDSTYVDTLVFSLRGDSCYTGSPCADTTLEWKFMHQCTEYEPLASNRQHVLSSSTGAWDTLEFWWNDEDPTQYTDHPIDVIFTVDANSMSPGPDSVVAINGDQMPLTFGVPSLHNMADDGIFPDAMADDGKYSIVVRFPASTFKTVEYKYLYNDVYECLLEDNRNVWLNDAAYDTVGGTLGPIEMPLQYYDRCSTIGRDVEVIFRVATLGMGAPEDTVAVNGTPNNQLPLVISWDIPSINEMALEAKPVPHYPEYDIYTVSIVFPDSSGKYMEYKFLHNSTYECEMEGNRSFFISDLYDAAGNPQILDLAFFGSCGYVDVPTEMPAVPFTLHQNYPNPFNPVTTISFDMPFSGQAALRIYNVKGALIRTVMDRFVHAGPVEITWDGTDERGRQLSSGVYFYELRAGSDRMSRKMILLR